MDTLRLIKLQEVMRVCAYSKSQVYKLIAAKEFPAGIRRSHRDVVWLEHEVQSHIRNLSEKASSKHNPAKLAGFSQHLNSVVC